MKIGSKLTEFSLTHYRLVAGVMVGLTLLVALAAAVPSLHLIDAMPGWVKSASRTAATVLPTITVDTDPENMLSEDEPVRVFHDEMKKRMTLHDMVVVGVVNEQDPNGVFNPGSLRKIYELTQFAKQLQFDETGDLLMDQAAEPAAQAPASVGPALPGGLGGSESDSPGPALPGGLGGPGPQATTDAPEIVKVHGVIPGDVIAPSTVDATIPQGRAIAFEWLMQTPPQTQEQALEIKRRAQRIPFLNDTLVSEDGRAIAIYLPITAKDLSYKIYSALQKKIDELGQGPEEFHITGLPVAEDTFGVQMFLQMAISAPAAMAVIFVLMLLFFRKLVLIVSPMIVAMVSVLLTMGLLIIVGFPIHIMSSMIPIFIMPIAVLDSIHIISDFFDRYQQTRDRAATMRHVMDELFMPMLYTSLTSAAGFASLALTPIPPVQVFGVFVAMGILAAWFWTVTFIPAFVMFLSEDRLKTFGRAVGSDESDQPHGLLGRFLHWTGGWTARRARPILLATAIVMVVAGYGISLIRVNDNPVKWFEPEHPIRRADTVLNDHFGGTYMAYLAMEATDDAEGEVFKQPAVLRWQRTLQDYLATIESDGKPLVGKSNSLTDIVRTVHRDLLAESVDDPKIAEHYRVPNTAGGVAETLLQYQSSHRYSDIDKFVTPDYRTSSMWLQLTSGDNRDMEQVVEAVEGFVAENPPPAGLELHWFGLTYINVIWQDKMVVGMLEAFAGSFLVVFLLMTILFRSPLWGLLSMVPLTVTIAAIYGAVGLVGKEYDMPVAVLSSLTLGLAVDFAIHFLARGREMARQYGSWSETAPHVFAEPARAITRNIIVIAAGFTPLLLAPLVPYQTVGILMATILLVSGVATLLILPALVRVLEKPLFRAVHNAMPAPCNCGLCIVAAGTIGVLLALNCYSAFGWGPLTWAAIAAVPVLALICGRLSRREKCNAYQKNSSPK
jgi:uncharacterized protein